MKTKTLNESSVRQEAIAILLDHMEPAKVAKFLATASIPAKGRNYLRERDRMFSRETVASLVSKVKRRDRKPSKAARRKP